MYTYIHTYTHLHAHTLVEALHTLTMPSSHSCRGAAQALAVRMYSTQTGHPTLGLSRFYSVVCGLLGVWGVYPEPSAFTGSIL